MAVLLVAGTASAHACVDPWLSPEYHFRHADAVFVGTVREVLAERPAGSVPRVRIGVEEVIKGMPAAEPVVRYFTGTASCNVQLQVGERRLFLVERLERENPPYRLLSTWPFGDRSSTPEASLRFAAAIALAAQVVADRPTNIDAHIALATAFEEWGDFDNAERVLAQTAGLAPNDPRVQFGVGRLAVLRRRFLDALLPLARAREADPDGVEVRFLLEHARRRTGDTEVATEVHLAGLELRNLRGRDSQAPLSRSRVDLDDRDLSGARFANLAVDELRLDRSHLDGGLMTESAVEFLSLSGAQLDRARFAGVSIFMFDARGARLDHAELHGSRMSIVDVRGAAATGIRLERIRSESLLADDADLRGARFADLAFTRSRAPRARFDGATFQDVVLYGIDFTDASFARAVATRSRFIGATFERTRFEGADLAGSDFTGSIFQEVDLGAARIAGARFANARLLNVDLSRADLSDVDLRAARYDCETRFPPGFMPMRRGAIPLDPACRPANERFVFDGADFSGLDADFSDLDMRGASFRGAILSNVNLNTRVRFWGANLRGADFSGSIGGAFSFAIDLRDIDLTDARDIRGFARDAGDPPVSLAGAIFRGVTFGPDLFAGFRGDVPADVGAAQLDGAILVCTRLDQEPQERARWVAWIRALEPRRRGVILGEGCERVPELADVR